MSMMDRLLTRWRRRYWHGSPETLARFAGLRPFTVITGASEGIGLAFARACAARGDNVVLVARGAERLEKVAQEISVAAGGDILALALDITSADAAAAISNRVQRESGTIELLVNNAGFGLGGTFHLQDAEKIDAMVQLNVAATTRLMRAFLPDMVARGAGGVINVSSLGGYGPGPWQSVYYATKAYVTSLSEAASYETRGLGVRIVAVAPGPVETAFHEKMGTNSALYRSVIPAATAEQVARAGLRAYRWGRRTVLPGLVSPLLMAAVRVTPHPVSLPLLGLLLRIPVGSPTPQK